MNTKKFYRGNGQIVTYDEMMKEIVSWVQSCGYECQINPDSYAASGIANKITK